MSEGDWRGNKDMERERQGDEKNKEDRDTAAEGQSITLLFQPQKEKFRYVSVERKARIKVTQGVLFIEICLIGSEKGLSLI